ncbi:hypothetical protein OUZ56_029829 [Daphnia magna]|uniref:Uncharacterized protein n=1 Tax=Daphnia magna TaxID=35525 RepID=A0ABR0B7Y0_9CRUS|nr:hypothetical protein OUZ56_029829 [Daphnia magna]
MYSKSDPDICRTSDGLPCVMWASWNLAMIADLQSSYSSSSPCSDTYSSYQSRASPLSLSEKNLSWGPPTNRKWHIGCGLDGGCVWSLGHVGVSLVYILRTLNVRADLASSVKHHFHVAKSSIHVVRQPCKPPFVVLLSLV